MANTEKPVTKAEQKKKSIEDKIKKIPEKQKLENVPLKKVEIKPKDESLPIKKSSESVGEAKPKEKTKSEKPKIHKTEAVVNGVGLHISTKYSKEICKFIKNKKIEQAISDLEQVILKKKIVPMRGEIAHKKGNGMMSGKYPKKASENFVKLIKSLSANAITNELEEPIIVKAITNFASRPHGKFGSIRKKRTHVKIIAREKKILNKLKRKKKRKNLSK